MDYVYNYVKDNIDAIFTHFNTFEHVELKTVKNKYILNKD